MGLRNLYVTTPLTASQAFGDWLASDEFLALVEDYRSRDEEPSCLLDIIALWVMNTDALLSYPNYQTFLLSILEITNQWQRDTQVCLGGFLWPLPQGADEDGLWINTLAGDYEPKRAYGRDVISHSVIREETFLLRQAALRRDCASQAPTRQ
ncbi:hypothetical protein [Microbacterium sp. SORGH_AS_0862]|uniref:hypothetical protein n=1 Tax=Microbacterium sp. SORGH_AS_0862 TaxID=3041789 RepID=UPI00278F133C|nr:hypothetical protein [Microbacterium sp. SORGH_AS_0862]MDQ1204641.1 hypothetical protein [Microbacterium sp. SORGH_AS_0862]